MSWTLNWEAQGVAIAYTLFLWWFSTGLILLLDGLPRTTYTRSLGAASVVLIAALYGLHQSAADASTLGAYCAFSCALIVWGWLEMSFLMGFITGPRRTACPPGARGWRRARFATEAVLHHELALLAGLVLVAALSWNAPNQIGLWTFMVLWASRLSAKLNVFLGARNLSEEFLPAHLRYLQTYFQRRVMNPLFPLSITLGTAVSVMLWRESAASDTAGVVLLASLMSLAVLEHWLMMLPLPGTAPWRWALATRAVTAPADPRA